MPEDKNISCARKPVSDTSRRILAAFGRAPASEGPATFKRDAEVPAEAENDLLQRGDDESVLAFDRPQFEFDRAKKWQRNNGGLEGKKAPFELAGDEILRKQQLHNQLFVGNKNDCGSMKAVGRTLNDVQSQKKDSERLREKKKMEKG